MLDCRDEARSGRLRPVTLILSLDPKSAKDLQRINPVSAFVPQEQEGPCF